MSPKTKKKTTKKIENFADGKIQERNHIEKVRDLEDLMRGSLHSPFKIKTQEEFERTMASMNLIDMQGMAVAAGIFPSGNKTTLRKKLKKEFERYQKGGKGRVFSTTQPIVDYDSLSEDQKKLFNING
jgi:hypothetical protein